MRHVHRDVVTPHGVAGEMVSQVNRPRVTMSVVHLPDQIPRAASPGFIPSGQCSGRRQAAGGRRQAAGGGIDGASELEPQSGFRRSRRQGG